jgi:hypothetical protein
LFADETTLPALAPGTGRTRTAWLTGLRPREPAVRRHRAADGGLPLRGEPRRRLPGASFGRRLGAGFSGLLQIDGYAAYRSLADPDRAGGPVTMAACWAHLRRRFYELHAAGLSETATWTVERMAALWAVEQEVRGRDPGVRRAVRQ